MTGRRYRGFTLIEMIMTMILLGIVALISVQFIGQTTEGYQRAATRQQLATIGWIASEKVSRELRGALPNSLRLHNPDASGRAACIEFMPTITAANYRSAPMPPSAARTTMTTIPIRGFSSDQITGVDLRLAIYPTNVSEVYGGAIPGPVSTSKLASVTPLSAPTTLTLQSAFQFKDESPVRRLYIAKLPVTYCLSSGYLYRYADYGIHSTAGSGLTNRLVIANRIDTSALSRSSFSMSAATLTRNAVVTISMRILDNESGEFQVVEQEVQLRNVP